MENINEREYLPHELLAFFDSETTDVPLWKERSSDERQPHIVEGAVLLYTHDGVLVDKFQAYAFPDGWASSPEAFATHGLTEEFLALNGIAESLLIEFMVSRIQRAGLRIAHNRTFDDRMMRIGLARFFGEEKADAYKEHPQEGADTALLAKPVCKLPATEAMKKTNFKNSYKTPTLGEAFAHLTGGKVLEGAHSALADAQACARVYFLLKGVRMPEFPDDAQALREESDRLPHGQAECDAAQITITEEAQCAE